MEENTDLGIPCDIKLGGIEPNFPLHVSNGKRIGLIGCGSSIGMAERILANSTFGNKVITVDQEQNKYDLIKKFKELNTPTPEELQIKRFKTYMFGETFDSFIDIHKHLIISDPFEKKDVSNQDFLIKNGFNTFELVKAEYLLIKTKQSNLSRTLRDNISICYENVTKPE